MECFISKPKHTRIEPIIILDSDDDCNPDDSDNNDSYNNNSNNNYSDSDNNDSNNSQQHYVKKNQKCESSYKNEDRDDDDENNNEGENYSCDDDKNYESDNVEDTNFTDATSNINNTAGNNSNTDLDNSENQAGSSSIHKSVQDDGLVETKRILAAEPEGFGRDCSKHLIGYDRNWEDKFTWLEAVTNEDIKAVGMLCTLCRKHKTENKYNHSKVWNETPCVCISKDSISHHLKSEMHVKAVQLESIYKATDKNGGIEQAFQGQVSLQYAAVKGAMQCLYWLVKSEIPHTTHYNSLIETMKVIGCDVFKHLHCGENAKYTSQRIIQEFLKVMGDHLRERQLTELCHSDHYSVMIDESIDIGVIKELVIYTRYLSAFGDVKNAFLTIMELTNGTADVIEESLVSFLNKSSISLSRLVGFASDGANVMTGCRNGVAARLARRQPLLTSTHCVAHRLALAASQAGDDVPYVSNTFKPTLQQLFYFYENSTVRMAGLKP